MEDNVGRIIADIWPQMLEKVMENWTFRIEYLRASRGQQDVGHMSEIIFNIQIIMLKYYLSNEVNFELPNSISKFYASKKHPLFRTERRFSKCLFLKCIEISRIFLLF